MTWGERQKVNPAMEVVGDIQEWVEPHGQNPDPKEQRQKEALHLQLQSFQHSHTPVYQTPVGNALL